MGADYLRAMPLGHPLPNSVHGVSCSLPTMADIIGYEEKRPETLRALKAGYPRFVVHDYVERTRALLAGEAAFAGRALFPVSSAVMARELAQFLGAARVQVAAVDDFFVVHFAPDAECESLARQFLQHTGGSVFSRQAEDFLMRRGQMIKPWREDVVEGPAAQERVISELARVFEARPRDVMLASCGMNAFYGTYRALSEAQAARGRRIWVQLGWLYLDTIEVLRKFAAQDHERILLSQVTDRAALEALFRERGAEIAGVVTEAPTNPLIQTADLKQLSALCRNAGAALVIDPSVTSPVNVRVLPYADACVVSLTKYAAHCGDVILGAAVFNPDSPFYAALAEQAPEYCSAPYYRDVQRLAFEIQDYAELVGKINRNTLELARFLEQNRFVKRVYWAYQENSAANYRAIERAPDSPGGLFCIELDLPLEKFYDSIAVAKGPSFGVDFTILCPFMYLAHYDLVSTPSGRAELRSHGIEPDLVRVSVGAEDAGRIIAAFDAALR